MFATNDSTQAVENIHVGLCIGIGFQFHAMQLLFFIINFRDDYENSTEKSFITLNNAAPEDNHYDSLTGSENIPPTAAMASEFSISTSEVIATPLQPSTSSAPALLPLSSPVEQSTPEQ